LAGLWDFPVVPDVSPSPDSSATFEAQARTLIESAIPSCSSPTPNVQIISVRHIGPVEHIFSHVRKTFETVLVELENESEEEPNVKGWMFIDQRLVEDDESGAKKPAKKKRKSDKRQEKESEGEEKVKWVVEGEVADAK
jgi:rRNA processing protein Gar1